MNNSSNNASVTACERAVKNRPTPSASARIGTLLMGLILSSLTPIPSALAATITVGNAGDHPTGNPANCNVASTCTLRDAIAKAANVTGSTAGDTIVFNLPANSTITLSGNELLVDRNLTIDGTASANLAISGNDVSRVLEVKSGVIAALSHLVVKKGNTDDRGGGIYNSGTLTISGSTVSGNTAGSGGGISNIDGATLEISESTISLNVAYGNGGIENLRGSLTLINSVVINNKGYADGAGGVGSNLGAATLIDSTIANNTGIIGGGIGNGASTLTVTRCKITGNTPGGIANYYYSTAELMDSAISDNSAPGISNNSSTMTLTHSVVSNNTQDLFNDYALSSGGGIRNDSSLTLKNSTISNNLAFEGGGISNNGNLTIAASTVSNNVATSGGGGGIYGGTIVLSDSTVSNNYANGNYGSGGGICGGDVVATNSTITGNFANKHGGGLYNSYRTTLTNVTLAFNFGSGGVNDVYNDKNAITASAANTLIQTCEIDGENTASLLDKGGNLDGGIGCGFTSTKSKSNAVLDLIALANYGGSTPTLMPRATSEAIDHGLLSTCNADPISGKDQRGFPRSPVACTSGAVDPNTAKSVNLNQHGLSGSWSDPTKDSQGFVMEIDPDFYGSGIGLLFAGWYTFDIAAGGGQRWYTLQAQISDKTASAISIYSTTDGRFDDPQATSTRSVGLASLLFSDCTHGILNYTFDGTDYSGSIPLTRLLSNTTCSPTGDSGTATVPTLLSGSWADTGNSGQGLVFDMNARDNVIFAGWYTFLPAGTSGSGAAGQRWYTLQATFKPGTSTPNGVGIYESTGGVFDSAGSTQIKKVGSGTLVFNTCTSATLTYTFTSGANNGKSGTLDLSRLTPAPAGCSL